jgi:hypothetical protein
MWIAEVTWHDGTRYYFGPFTEYEAGIKKWSAEFSYEHGSRVYSIDYHKLQGPITEKRSSHWWWDAFE